MERNGNRGKDIVRWAMLVVMFAATCWRPGSVAAQEADVPQGTLLLDRIDRIIWNGEDWLAFSRTEFHYDGGRTLVMKEVLEQRLEDWERVSRETYTRDESGRLIERMTCSRQDGQWCAWLRDRYVYDDIERNHTVITEEWDGLHWLLLRSSISWLAEDGITDSTLETRWQNSDWLPVTITVTERDMLSRPSGYLRYDCQTGRAIERQKLARDGMGRVVTTTLESSTDGVSWQWESRVRTLYDEAGKQIVDIMDEWRDGAWEEWIRDEYHYRSVTSVTVTPTPLPGLACEVYPNPGSTNRTLRLHTTYDRVLTLRICDLLGRDLRSPWTLRLQEGWNDIPLQLLARSEVAWLLVSDGTRILWSVSLR